MVARAAWCNRCGLCLFRQAASMRRSQPAAGTSATGRGSQVAQDEKFRLLGRGAEARISKVASS